MTAWGVAQTKNKFKAGCMGAGVSDWGAMSAESRKSRVEDGRESEREEKTEGYKLIRRGSSATSLILNT